MDIERADPYEFGLLIPRYTNDWWEHQIDGHACRELSYRGIYLRFVDLVPKSCWGPMQTWITQIVECNARGEDTSSLWDVLDSTFPFEYMKVDSPYYRKQDDGSLTEKDRVISIEGVKWVSIDKMKDGFDPMFAFDEYRQKKIMMIYPNCD